jgi:glycosyltransferase involved in cell wall biosynthesis
MSERRTTTARERRPPRIAFVSDSIYPFNTGGKERRLWEIARRLARAGIDVHVYTMKWWDGPGTIASDGVVLHALCRYHPLYHGAHRSATQALLFGTAVLKLVGQRFDAFDVDHMPYFPLFTARLVCSLRGERLVATWHEVWGREYWPTYASRLGRVGYLIERLAVRTPDEIVSNSEQTTTRLRELLHATKPIATVPLGVDFERIDATRPSSEGADVLYAGRLLDNKGVDVLLRAVAIAAAQEQAITCLIVGEGPERQRLQTLSRQLGITGNVRFLDFLPGDEIYGVMKSSGVFVLPSKREGFGLVVIEANACGLPVITVRHPDNAARHLIIEGENGLLCDLDPADLAKGIQEVLSRRPSMRPRQTLESVRASRDWDQVARRVAGVLLGLGGASGGSV